MPFWLQDPPARSFLLFLCSLLLAWGPFSSPASIFGFLTHWDPWPWVEVRSGSVAKLSLGQLLHFRAFAFPSEKPSRDCSVAQSSGAARRVMWRNSWQLRELVELILRVSRSSFLGTLSRSSFLGVTFRSFTAPNRDALRGAPRRSEKPSRDCSVAQSSGSA